VADDRICAAQGHHWRSVDVQVDRGTGSSGTVHLGKDVVAIISGRYSLDSLPGFTWQGRCASPATQRCLGAGVLGHTNLLTVGALLH
jgi:hypothetical protein